METPFTLIGLTREPLSQFRSYFYYSREYFHAENRIESKKEGLSTVLEQLPLLVKGDIKKIDVSKLIYIFVFAIERSHSKKLKVDKNLTNALKILPSHRHNTRSAPGEWSR